jgi:radical SAM superfamily enzyme YgiQ (UPF0313 family)
LKTNILLITPPLTQLNTPYPATAYLKRFLNGRNITCHQSDLGIEMVLYLFSKKGLTPVFTQIEKGDFKLSANAKLILKQKEFYLNTIDAVIRFLQNKDLTLAHRINRLDYLPKASRFNQIIDLEWTFGTLGLVDKARHIATLYLEDIGDLIVETISPHFGFSKYAEKLGLTAVSFAPLEKELLKPNGYVEEILCKLLEEKIKEYQPTLIGFTVPFPGNLYGALKCAQYIKKNYPTIKTMMGGGYANTELRQLTETKVFDYFDFITLDDGEGPVLKLIEFLEGNREVHFLQRTYLLENGKVSFANGCLDKDISHTEAGYPDYSELPLTEYLSVLDMPNPMHRLWSDGRWNKLTIAHGCYWKKCSFCDVTLDYINRYETSPAEELCNRIEKIVNETGQTGFHFVDEAAPPLVLRDLALEIIKKGISITWWANIRFEKTFTPDLCKLLAKSGCIAVSGGLEVASDRLLMLMEKGVTIEQVSKVTQAFTENGILVHAYLMYGFPTQTEQETIDSLEIVRQLFENGLIQSGFWHRFAMTAHSPVGKNPEKYQVKKIGPEFKGFAWNDLWHEDPKGADHDKFTKGLNTSLYNFMQGAGFEMPLQQWFDFKIKPTTHKKNLVNYYLNKNKHKELPEYKVIWLGAPLVFEKTKKEATYTSKNADLVTLSPDFAEWLEHIFEKLAVKNTNYLSLKDIAQQFETDFEQNAEVLFNSSIWQILREEDLVVLRF